MKTVDEKAEGKEGLYLRGENLGGSTWGKGKKKGDVLDFSIIKKKKGPPTKNNIRRIRPQ